MSSRNAHPLAESPHRASRITHSDPDHNALPQQADARGRPRDAGDDAGDNDRSRSGAVVSPRVGNDVFLGRQPILDRDQQLVAYELLFRSGQQNSARFSDGRMATATVIRNLFSELSIADVLGKYRGYINLDEETLFSDALELLPTDAVALELLETVVPTHRVIRRCAELKALGYTLALDDVVQIGDRYRALLPHIDIVKIDLKAIDPLALPDLVRSIKQLGKVVLAEKVDSQEVMQRCHGLGVDLFQGYFFARPMILRGRKLDHSQLVLLDLMNLLVADAENDEIEAVFKREPGLTLNLLRLTNSVSSGLSVTITSLRHAIALLGRRKLQRWLQLLLYTSSSGNADRPLLRLAATRARLMELMAEAIDPDDKALADNAFITGILSLTPALLHLSIEEIVAGLTLNGDIQVALCRHEGALGDLLTVAESLEEGRLDRIEATLARLGNVQVSELNRCLAQALAWANHLG